ncbi:MAG: TIGR02530 family flagellar biosynthesis protein [Anaerolineaceae bacterium]
MANDIYVNPAQRPNNTATAQTRQQQVSGEKFADVLAKTNQVTFSNHAQKRIDSREIDMGNGKMERLAEAVDKAKAHGGTESLILMDDLAFIVNVKSGVVVTTVDVNQRSQGVFTKIDSVVIASPDEKTSNSGTINISK